MFACSTLKTFSTNYLLSCFDYVSHYYLSLDECTDLVTFTEEIFNGKLHFLCSNIDWIFKNFELTSRDFEEKSAEVWHRVSFVVWLKDWRHGSLTACSFTHICNWCIIAFACNYLCSSSSPSFFFFYQLYPGLRNCKSVFLILKISQYGGLGLWVRLFPRYPCKNWYKNWYFYFYKTYDPKFAKQVHLQDLTQMRQISRCWWHH